MTDDSAAAAGVAHEDSGFLSISKGTTRREPIRMHFYGDHGHAYWNNSLPVDTTCEDLETLRVAVRRVANEDLQSALAPLGLVAGRPYEAVIRSDRPPKDLRLVGGSYRTIVEIRSEGQFVSRASMDSISTSEFLWKCAAVLETGSF